MIFEESIVKKDKEEGKHTSDRTEASETTNKQNFSRRAERMGEDDGKRDIAVCHKRSEVHSQRQVNLTMPQLFTVK